VDGRQVTDRPTPFALVLRSDNASLREEISRLDEQVAQLRDKVRPRRRPRLHVALADQAAVLAQLTKAKRRRDELRTDNGQLKQKQGFVGSDLLVGDFEQRKSVIEERRREIAALRARHSALTAQAAQQ
jgi:hypothetical protein